MKNNNQKAEFNRQLNLFIIWIFHFRKPLILRKSREYLTFEVREALNFKPYPLPILTLSVSICVKSEFKKVPYGVVLPLLLLSPRFS
jgi:hypothetical protein